MCTLPRICVLQQLRAERDVWMAVRNAFVDRCFVARTSAEAHVCTHTLCPWMTLMCCPARIEWFNHACPRCHGCRFGYCPCHSDMRKTADTRQALATGPSGRGIFAVAMWCAGSEAPGGGIRGRNISQAAGQPAGQRHFATCFVRNLLRLTCCLVSGTAAMRLRDWLTCPYGCTRVCQDTGAYLGVMSHIRDPHTNVTGSCADCRPSCTQRWLPMPCWRRRPRQLL